MVIYKLINKKGFTLVEVMIAFSIFLIILSLSLGVIIGGFRYFKEGEDVAKRQQKKRFLLFRLNKEVSSLTRILYPGNYFKGDEKGFFFVFSQEDSLAESGYLYNSLNHTLERYFQQPPDWRQDTYQTKEIILSDLEDCKFAYSDGQNWLINWEDTKKLPQMIKINFRFKNETKECTLNINIPISP
jgi:prepilin-type N-terminal cleavage/methylation domain-containing protein